MDNSPLNNLAAELRNRIYEFALGDPRHSGPIEVELVCDPVPRIRRKFYGSALCGLTKACKQIRQESMAVFVGSRDFVLTGNYRVNPPDACTYFSKPCADKFIEWATSLGQYTRRTSFITVDFFSLKLRYYSEDRADLIEALKEFKCRFQAVGLRPKLQVRTPRWHDRDLNCWQSLSCQILSRFKMIWEGDFNDSEGEALRRDLEQFMRVRRAAVAQSNHSCGINCREVVRSLEYDSDEIQELISLLDEDPAWSWEHT